MSLHLIGAITLAILCTLAIAAIVVWVMRRRYTRERFAFFAVTSCITLTASALVTIAGDAPPWQQVLIILHYLRTGEILPTSLSPTVSAMIVVMLFGVYYLTYLLFQAWDGQVSRDTYFARKAENDRRLFLEASLGWRNLFGKASLAPYKPPSRSVNFPNLGKPVASLPWRDLCRLLLRLKRSALEFGEWRSEHGFWLATHRDHGHTIAIKCSTTMPGQASLDAFTSYTAKMVPTPEEHIVCIRKAPASQPTSSTSDVTIITLEEMLTELVDFSEYAEKIRDRVARVPLQDSEVTLEQCYVAPRFRHEDLRRTEQNIELAIHHWLSESTPRQLAILGEYGQGKSTVALMLTHNLLSRGVGSLERIPILIELRGKSPKSMTPGELLGAWGDAYGIASRPLRALHEAGKLLLIFDGFDEMALVGNPQERLRHFQTLWGFNNQHAKIIITGRPNLFLDNNELKAALGILPGSSGRLACEAWYLEKFNTQEIWEALRNVPQEVRTGIVQAVEVNPRLRDLVSRPSLLHVLSVLWGDGAIVERADDITASELTERFLKASLVRQTEKAREIQRRRIEASAEDRADGPRNYMVLNSAERKYFMVGIAAYLMKRGETNHIGATELDAITEKLALTCPLKVSQAPSLCEWRQNMSIAQRIRTSQDFLGRLKDDVRASGLLVKDVVDETFRFGHKSFMEFLAADFAERKLADEDTDVAIHALSACLECSFADVLRNPVTQGYFGELILVRRGGASRSSKSEIAAFLLKRMVQPGFLERAVWSHAVGLLRRYGKSIDDSGKTRSFVGRLYRRFSFEFARDILSEFTLRDRKERQQLPRPFVIRIGVGLCCGVIFALIIAGIATNSIELLILSVLLFVYVTGFGFFFIRVYRKRELRRRRSLSWVITCKNQGCDPSDIYVALLGAKRSHLKPVGDPLDLFRPLEVEYLTPEDSRSDLAA